jgi:hypothetical protein
MYIYIFVYTHTHTHTHTHIMDSVFWHKATYSRYVLEHADFHANFLDDGSSNINLTATAALNVSTRVNTTALINATGGQSEGFQAGVCACVCVRVFIIHIYIYIRMTLRLSMLLEAKTMGSKQVLHICMYIRTYIYIHLKHIRHSSALRIFRCCS